MENSDNMPNFREYEEYLEKKVVIMLRDGRFYYGTFKSFDQYNSVTLNYAMERIFDGDEYAELFHGLIVIRGENIALLGLSNGQIKNCKLVDYKEMKNRIEQKSKDCLTCSF